ncbi:Receptor kinase-like protein Xa21 [Euphorbia peplus]|nr:Receptor kinase-like protein Xa21 [Euphorbia peplus]
MGKLISSMCVIIILLISCLLMSLDEIRARNISSDEDALLAFKAHITNDPQSVIASNWTTATSVCDWVGITCGTRHHRVSAIALNDMGLIGTIPPQIGNLSFLVNFSLYGNHFHGSLPDQLAYLRRLKSLSLGNNLLSGIIPSWVGSFIQLQYLSLHSNNFGGGFPISICNLAMLHHVFLERNNLEGKIPEEIGNLQSLEILNLRENKFSGGVPIGIFNISALQQIDIGGNFLSGNLSSNMFTHLPSLEALSFSRNLLSGSIPSTLFACNKLQILSLSLNYFEGDLHSDFGNLTMLQELYLGYNNFRGEIPKSIENLVNLELLNIRRTSIGGEIPSSIGNLTRLRQLDFGNNMLTGRIPFGIGNFAYLEDLGLGINRLHGTIPSNIFNMSVLTRLNLAGNNLSGSIPPSFGLHIPNLEQLFIGANNFHGPIPISISNASKLTNIDLNFNMFSGSIPVAFGNLRNLRSLSMWSNQLRTESLSTLFSSLASCKNLTFLDLGQNPLNASLPISIGKLSSSLETFYIVGNGLTGTIPKEIGNLKSLILLDLGSNNLSGFIPKTIGKLRKLQGLYINSNRIQGSIPSELCGLQSLSEINFGGNELFENIPSCFGNLTSLRKLNLESNKLSSTIPSNVWRLKDLLELKLSSNNLSGSLSLEIGNMKAVTLLDLSGNQLSGSIPSTFGDLQSITRLSLSINRFEGSIPESFGDAISLVFMDLSINNLSGEIPKSLEKLIYLKDFNVSFNQLQGEIPKGGPFVNLSAQSFLGNKALCGDPKFLVHSCKASHQNLSKEAKTVLVVIGTTVLALGTLIVFLIWYWKRKTRLSTHQNNSLLLPTWQRISIHELNQATNKFDQVNLLGKGSFGSVYKGTLLDGMLVAVKVFNLEVEGAFKSFDVECEVLRRIRHRNLVKIITSCCTIDVKALVMELMPNWSLEKWLYSHNYFLNTLQRLNIMIDVGSALEYLHHGTTEPVVHCDLKPNNILLDGDMVAHVTDFGISKLVGEDESVIQTITLATVGYMAPEYGSEGLVSIKGDIYSFGILLMETFTRRRPTDDMFNEDMSIKQWIKELLPSGVAQFADPNLIRVNEQHLFSKTNCISSIMDLAMNCCEETPKDRMSSKEVVSALNKIKVKLLNDVQEA